MTTRNVDCTMSSLREGDKIVMRLLTKGVDLRCEVDPSQWGPESLAALMVIFAESIRTNGHPADVNVTERKETLQ
jgi:hypothetical protein